MFVEKAKNNSGICVGLILALCIQIALAQQQQQIASNQNNNNNNNNVKPQVNSNSLNANSNQGVTFVAPAQGQLTQQRQIAQVGQMLLNGVQQLAGAASAPMQALGVNSNSNSNNNQQQPAASFIANAISNVQSSLSNNLGALASVASPAVASNTAPANANSANNNGLISSMSLNEQGEILRQEIYSRANQLQQVVSSSLNSLRDNKDLIMKRLLEQMSVRLDHARAKADRIISEPANNELAVKALATINNGLTNINNIVTNLVKRLDPMNSSQASSTITTSTGSNGNRTETNQIDHGEFSNANTQSTNSNSISQRVGTGAVNDANASKFPFNLQQIRQQFSSAISTIQKQIAPQTQQSQSQQIVKTSLAL